MWKCLEIHEKNGFTNGKYVICLQMLIIKYNRLFLVITHFPINLIFYNQIFEEEKKEKKSIVQQFSPKKILNVKLIKIQYVV